MKGLFINNAAAKDSIHISGKMVFDCLKLSEKFQIDYHEISKDQKQVPGGYDFYFINYHPHTMAWLDTVSLRKLLGFVGTIVLEVSPGDPFVLCPEKDFDFYCVLDPTIKDKKNVFSFPRPLPIVDFELPVINNTVPVIGSFGFATKGKGFQHVVEAVNKEFDKAVIKINIPFGDFVPESKEYAAFLENVCRQKAKPGIELKFTNDFMSEKELILWCASNTLNCFLYDRKMPGLSATTDQAIVSGRPLSISDNETFRHITQYIKPYPQQSLKETVEHGAAVLKRIQNDWSAENFVGKFESILTLNKSKLNEVKSTANIVLFEKKQNMREFLKIRVKKYKRKFTLQHIKSLIYDSGNRKKII